MNTAREMFDLSLPDFGPYAIDYTKNGRFLLLGGRKGHLALMDTLRMDIQMEVRYGCCQERKIEERWWWCGFGKERSESFFENLLCRG